MAEYIKVPDDLVVEQQIMRGLDTIGVRRIDLSFLPVIDAVEVVRCKDCKHFVYDMDLNHEEYPNEIEADGLCEITDKYCDMPHFCSYGERKEENGC